MATGVGIICLTVQPNASFNRKTGSRSTGLFNVPMQVGKTAFRNNSALMKCLRAETGAVEILATEAFHNQAGRLHHQEVISHRAVAVVVVTTVVVSGLITDTAIMAVVLPAADISEEEDNIIL
jgi:hypothetical protein